MQDVHAGGTSTLDDSFDRGGPLRPGSQQAPLFAAPFPSAGMRPLLPHMTAVAFAPPGSESEGQPPAKRATRRRGDDDGDDAVESDVEEGEADAEEGDAGEAGAADGSGTAQEEGELPASAGGPGR